METLKLFPEREVASQRDFHRKPLTRSEGKKALDCSKRIKAVELPTIDTGSADDPRQTFCNEKIGKAISMVLENGRTFDNELILNMIFAVQRWYTSHSRNGRGKLSMDEARSLLVRLYRLEPLPVRKGETTPRVMDADEWKAHLATLEQEAEPSDCDCKSSQNGWRIPNPS
jgi:hypothetical protein